jgi:excisionase family DNA binding protein
MDMEKWLTLEELSSYIKIGRTKLYRMAQDSIIPAFKVGSQWRFDREEIDKWLTDNCRAGDFKKPTKLGQ